MTFITDAINKQIDQSIFSAEQPVEAKIKIVNQCDNLKKVAAIVAFVVPVFALFLPTAFCVVGSLVMGVAAYDLFNIADNLGDAAKLSAEGNKHTSTQKNIEMMLESTLLARPIYNFCTHSAV